jgi:glutaredoxin
MSSNITLYALSTCGWCKKMKKYLNDHNIEYILYDVDLLEGEEKEKAKQEVSRHNPKRSYPTLVIDDSEVIAGYNVDRLEEVFGS